jgi:hypothetical protein
MPVRKRGRYWHIGKGKARYKSKKSANKAYRGYRARKHGKRK